jgi:hypothetical protein
MSPPRRSQPLFAAESFITTDDLVLLVLALGAALVIGNVLALIRPSAAPKEGDLARAPVARSVVMIGIGLIAAIWALATLTS